MDLWAKDIPRQNKDHCLLQELINLVLQYKPPHIFICIKWIHITGCTSRPFLVPLNYLCDASFLTKKLLMKVMGVLKKKLFFLFSSAIQFTFKQKAFLCRGTWYPVKSYSVFRNLQRKWKTFLT